jgi:hypothetical protein
MKIHSLIAAGRPLRLHGARAVRDAEARSMLVANPALGFREGRPYKLLYLYRANLGRFRDNAAEKSTNFRWSNP